MKKFYITTTIPYVNASPHLGHVLENIQADVIARHHRLQGDEVLFLTGTDENSLKNVRAAEASGISVREWVDRKAGEFLALKEVLNVSLDDFIRTTEKRHIKGSQALWESCKEDIYKKKYQGLYCVGCEQFYKEDELENGLCPEHKTKPELVEEENYFFRLSRYQDELKEIIEKDQLQITPEIRKNEVLSFIVKQGLEDICISRSVQRARGWGIQVPGDKDQVLWVWFDALSNYINAVGYAQDEKKFQKWWPADLHCLGKGVLRFHAVYWPGMLLAAKLPLPKKIFVHGYITVGGEKMSKTLGNVTNPFELVKKYGADAVRYYLLGELSSTDDGDFTEEKFQERYRADLASGIGNLVSRVLTMAEKIDLVAVGNPATEAELRKTQDNCARALDEFKFNEALKAIWDFIHFCDRYVEQTKPWAGGEGTGKVVYGLLTALHGVARLLQPFLPETARRIAGQLGTSLFAQAPARFQIKKEQSLFPRI